MCFVCVCFFQDTAMSKVWFKQDDKFFLPKACLNFEFFRCVFNILQGFQLLELLWLLILFIKSNFMVILAFYNEDVTKWNYFMLKFHSVTKKLKKNEHRDIMDLESVYIWPLWHHPSFNWHKSCTVKLKTN